MLGLLLYVLLPQPTFFSLMKFESCGVAFLRLTGPEGQFVNALCLWGKAQVMGEGYRRCFCKKCPEASPMCNRDDASQLLDGLTTGQGWALIDSGSTSGIMYLSRTKICCTRAASGRREDESMQQKNSADTKVSAFRAGGAPGTRAGIPLWPVSRLWWRSCAPAAYRVPRWSRALPITCSQPQARAGRCPKEAVTPWDSPWNKFLTGSVGLGREEPTLDPVCWQNLWPPKRIHAERVHKELPPVGRIHIEEVHGGPTPVGGMLLWSRAKARGVLPLRRKEQ